MSKGSGDKPPSDSSPGRPAADTPQRLIVRSLDGGNPDTAGFSANDTAVAVASRTSATQIGHLATDAMPALDKSLHEDLVGTTLSGRYLVTRQIGQGGMGAVYEATHTLIGKQVAVKVLLAKYAQREALVARLKQEAQLASSLRNENIIDITDFGDTDDGRTFVVMELLEGESLAECLSREPKLPEQRILRIAAQAASALAAAHAKGIVHRDIKPENLFLQKRKELDWVKVVDFGISKSLRVSEEEEQAPRLTQTGMVLGTPLYMSPEQARGDEDLDHRVDIYALGVIMYESATGRVPFAGNNYLSVISLVLNDEPAPLRSIRPDLSEEFEAIVSRAMAKNREQRYPSANAMLEDLSALLDDPTRSTERAKITGPRRRAAAKTKGFKVAIWIAALSSLVAVIVVTVMVMNGGSAAKPQKVATPPPAIADAAVAVVLADAAPAEPAVKTITLHVVSEPAGAEIYKESEYVGKTPVDLEFAFLSKEVSVTAQLPGYEGHLSINPIERKDGQIISLKLTKTKNPPKLTRPKPPATGAGSGAALTTNHTAGELTGDPFAGSGTLPKK